MPDSIAMDHLPIDHVVVLMMENNCFDRMLGCMQQVRPGLDGVDPANPRNNPGPDGPVVQRQTTTRNILRDPKHFLPNAIAQYAGGRCDGFVTDFCNTHPNATAEDRAEVMAWYPRGFLPALHMLAEQFVVCDRWFSSVPGPTWINRLFAQSGTSLGQINEPGGLFNSALHIYNERTLYDELTDNAVEWRVYFGDVPQSVVMTHQLLHLNKYRRYRHFASDVRAGHLPAFTFIEPTYFGPGQNDQHPPHDIMRGDALIAEVYNTLRQNAALFAKTLLIVLYDEHGGFYDHVPPPATVAPDGFTEHYGFDRLGFRVPAILVSPLLDPGLNSTVLDHTSLLRMAAGLWPGVSALGARAQQANDPLAGLGWRDSPREDLPAAEVAPDIQPALAQPRLEGFKASLFGLTHHLERLIDHRKARHGLMQRAHESLDGSMAQAKLATDRVEALLEHPGAGLVDTIRKLLGLE